MTLQDLRMIWFLFKINPEKGRSVFLVKTHFLLLRTNSGFYFCLSWNIKKRTVTRWASLQYKKMRKKRENRDCIIISVEKGRHTSLTETLSLASASTSCTRCKCSAGFLRRSFGDSHTKFWGRQTPSLKRPVWTLPRAGSEPFQTLLQWLLLKPSTALLVLTAPEPAQPAPHPAVHGDPGWERDCISFLLF